MDAFLQILRNIGTVRLGAMATVAIGLVAFFVFLTTRLASPNMSLLYADLEGSDTGQIVAILQNEGVPVETRKKDAEKTDILVPAQKVGLMRLKVAEQGLPGSGTIGYEIIDREETLGSSSFVQEINRVRALEGELSRTISASKLIRGARVHLVLPRRELFTREKQVPSASIALRMNGANRLGAGQVQAIQHLVAAAVPGLQPSRISIVDDRGNLLARLGDSDDPLASNLNPQEMRIAYEQRASERVTRLLEPVAGFGKVRVVVTAELDLETSEINKEEYDPDGQVVRSTQEITDSSQSKDGGVDAVTVGQNLPDADQVGGGGGSQSQANRTEAATNFEITKTTSRTIRKAGKLVRQTVAVLVEGKTSVGPNGEQVYTARTAEELESFDKVARGAVGFVEDRDTLDVVEMRFAPAPVSDEDITPSEIFGFNKSDLVRLAELLVLGVVGILVILLVVRPLISRIFEASAAAADAIAQATEQQMLTDQSGGTAALAGPPGSTPAAAGGAMTPAGMGMGAGAQAEEDEAMINLSNIEGRVKASSLRKIGDIIDKHPEEAVSIMRTWMYQDG